jgi:hypothetical protein
VAWNSKLHGTVGTYYYCSVALTLPWRLLFHGAYYSTPPNFHRFVDQIKVARDKILRTFIESVENKVAHYQIGGNLGRVE